MPSNETYVRHFFEIFDACWSEVKESLNETATHESTEAISWLLAARGHLADVYPIDSAAYRNKDTSANWELLREKYPNGFPQYGVVS